MRLSKQGVSGTLYVDGINVVSVTLHGQFFSIYSLERLFLGGVPKNFVATRVPVSRFAASLFDVRCNSVDPITGGVLNRSVGVYIIPDEFRPSMMSYTASSLSFSSAFRYARTHFRYSLVSLYGLRKKDRLVVVY